MTYYISFNVTPLSLRSSPQSPIASSSPHYSSDARDGLSQSARMLNMTVGQSQGRIKVYCRTRCFDAKAMMERGGSGVKCGGAEQDEITLNYMRDEKSREASFGFDRVFSPDTTNSNVFEEVGRPLVTSVLCGYNATLMAYGQTGSGKTHSLASNDGLINTMVGHLFKSIAEGERPELFHVSLSYIQVYNEKAYDLLHPTSTERALTLKNKKGGGVYLEGASDHRARSMSEVLELIHFGRTRLHFAETRMNRHSSRSHAVCVVTVQRTVGANAEPTATEKADPAATGEVTPLGGSSAVNARSTDAGEASSSILDIEAVADEVEEIAAADRALSQALESGRGSEVAVSARLTLVDLAGSERIKRTGAVGATLAEAQKINLSLLELGNVIATLSDQATAKERRRPSSARKAFVPFRNSTLTRLLQESLGGNCKTSLLLCVSPAAMDAPETRGTLEFGSRAMRVRQEAVINARANYEEVAEKLAKQLEDKEAVWQRRNAVLDAKLKEARVALAARDQEVREMGERLAAAREAERRIGEAEQRAVHAEARAAEAERRAEAEIYRHREVASASAARARAAEAARVAEEGTSRARSAAGAARRCAHAAVGAARMPTAPNMRERPEVRAAAGRPEVRQEARAAATAGTTSVTTRASREAAREVTEEQAVTPTAILDETVTEGTCVVCLEQLGGSHRACSFQCAHFLCTDCDARLRRIGDHRCPTCRAPRIGYSTQDAEQAAAARFAPDTSRDRGIAEQHAAGFATAPAQQRPRRSNTGTRDVGADAAELADGRWARPRPTAVNEPASAAQAAAVDRVPVARGVAVVAAEGVAPGSVAVGVPVSEAEATGAAGASASPQVPVVDDEAEEAGGDEEVPMDEAASEAMEEAALEAASETGGASEASLEAHDAVTEVLEIAEAADDVALESLRHALGEAEEAQAADSRRTLAVLRWRHAAFWVMSHVSLAARRNAMRAVAAAAAERQAVDALRAKLVAAAEAELRSARVELEALAAAELEALAAAEHEALTQLEGERRERASERADAQTALMETQAELANAHAELSKAQTIERSSAVAAASRIAAAGVTLAEGIVVGTAGTQTSPIRDVAAAAARWQAAVGDEQRVGSTFACQTGDVEGEQEGELTPAPVRARKPKAPRRRWLVLSCGATRV